MMKVWKRNTLFAVLLLALAVSLWAAEEPPTPVATLANGLTVIIRENHAAPVASVRVFVRTGAMLEGKYLGAGISHVCEHLVAGGTTRYRTEKQYREALDKLGGNTNAATSLEWTQYFIDTTAENVHEAIDVLSEWMSGASITEAEYTREMGVINRELERSLDNPDYVIERLALENLFHVHPSRLPVIGYRNVLNGIKRQDVIDYYSERYVPNNMVVVVVGDFNAAKVKAHVEKAFSKGEQRPIALAPLRTEPEQVAARTVVREMEDVKGTRLRIDFPTVGLTHPDLYPLDVLSFILSEGESSRLVQRLRDEKGLVQGITTWSVTPSYGAGYFAVSAELESKKLEKAKAAILQELYRLKTEPVTREEIEKAKIQKISEHAFAEQTVARQADESGFNYLDTFDPDFGRHYTENIQNVTREQIAEVARKYFRPEKLCVTAVVPKGEAVETVEKAPVVEPTAFQRVKLENGVVVLLKQNAAAPIVTVKAYFEAGVRAETAKTNGLSFLTAEMLRRGTSRRNAAEIADAFDKMGGTLTTGSGNNSLYAAASVLKKDLPDALEVFADVILHPSFTSSELQKMKNRQLFLIKESDDDPMDEAMRFFRQSFYRSSPYGRVPLGTAESVTGITRDDVVRFHGSCVQPWNMKLAIVGDVVPAEVERLARKYFGDFKGAGASATAKPAAEAPLAESRAAVKVNQKQGAVVFVGFQGLKMTDVDDRAAMAVVEAILTGYGYPGGWLHEELRGKELVYEVHGFGVPGVEPGFFAIYARCQPDKVKQVTDIIIKNVEKMKQEGATPQELELAKDKIATSEMLDRQTNPSQADDAATGEMYGVGYDYEMQFVARVKKVTLDDVKKAAQKYFTKYVLTVTTPDEKVVKDLTPRPVIVR
jgi:zinc protease